MILTIIIIAVIGGVAYFHYAQGFFSATMSAACAVIAAVLAVGYHETVVNSVLQGAVADYADALCLAAIFALVYIILRVIIDKAVPGNIRIPNTIDRVGGAAVGIVAGCFTAGVVALVAQMLPYGPRVGMYARYAVEDHPEVNLPPNAASRGRSRTGDINDQLTENRFDPEKKSSLKPPVDDMLLSIVQGLSNGGSLAGNVQLTAIHPDYTDELFAQRLGIQIGGKHTAMNLPGKTPQVTVPDKGVFRVTTDLGKTAIDAELTGLHQSPLKYTTKPNDLQLVIRVIFNKDAADSDGWVRFAPASVRLCAGGVNYFPVGTLEGGKTLYLNKPDDFLFIQTKDADRGADFVFDIGDPSAVIAGGPKDPNPEIKPGVFIEVKRLAKIDLGGRAVTTGVTASKQVQVARKENVGPQKGEKGAGGEEAAAATEFTFTNVTVSNKLFSAINTGTPDKDTKNTQTQSGTLSLSGGQLAMLDINPTQSLTMLKQGSYAVDDLYVRPGMKLVQIQGAPPAEGGDPWAWGALSKWQLIDAQGKTYRPSGGFARVSKENAERMVAVYSATETPRDISGDGRPLDAWVVFQVPAGTQLKTVKFDNKIVKADLGTTAQ